MVQNEKIQAIRERLDIAQIVGGYVQLKKQGKRYVGCCPFHNEKTPSFSVSPDKGLFYCFGCHAGGDAFDFVMRHEGLDFMEAARRLGDKVGVPLEPESPEKLKQRKLEADLERVNKFALAFFEHALMTDGGAPGRTYFKSRGLTESIATTWRLGFGGGPGELLAYFEKKRVPKELAHQAGLLTDDGTRALFEGRVVFPVFDTQNRLAGFGGRRLGDGNTPKYLNSRETPLFKKSRLLFGWEHAEEVVKKSRRVILVEGYMDVIACHTGGLTEAVAALGTSFTDEHAQALSRFTKEVVLFLDGDAAGQAASEKAAARLLANKIATYVAALPPGLDPDSCLRKEGQEALAKRVKEAVPALEYFMAKVEPSQSIEQRALSAQRLAPLFSAMGSGLERDLYMAKLAERVGVSAEQLDKHLKAIPVRERREEKPAKPTVVETPAVKPASLDAKEMAMLRDLLLFPELWPRFPALAEYVMCDAIRDALTELGEGKSGLAEVLLRHLGPGKQAERLAAVQPLSGDDTAVRAEKTYNDVLKRLKARHVDVALKEVIRELSEAESKGDETDDLIRRKQDLTRRKNALLARPTAGD